MFGYGIRETVLEIDQPVFVCPRWRHQNCWDFQSENVFILTLSQQEVDTQKLRRKKVLENQVPNSIGII